MYNLCKCLKQKVLIIYCKMKQSIMLQSVNSPCLQVHRVWQLSITWILLVPLPAKYDTSTCARQKKNTVNFVWPFSKLRPPNLTVDTFGIACQLQTPNMPQLAGWWLSLSLASRQRRAIKGKYFFCNMGYFHSSDHHSYRLCWEVRSGEVWYNIQPGLQRKMSLYVSANHRYVVCWHLCNDYWKFH